MITGIGTRSTAVLRPSATVYAALRHSHWAKVVGVTPPTPLPVNDRGNPFWSSEFFDMCFDPWSDSTDPGDPYYWGNGKAAPPAELFPGAAGGTGWATQIDGRHPEFAPNGLGRYGKRGHYSFCDGHVSTMDSQKTYQSPNDNMWSVR